MQQALAVPKPIASYECYDLTNEGMSQNPVLTDLTGNGHDITCHNFAWSGMSGYGGYHLNFRNWNSDNSSTFDRELTANKVVFTNIDNYTESQLNLYRAQTLDAINGIKFKVSGMDDGEIFGVLYKEPGSQSGSHYIKITSIESDGEVTANIPVSSIILLNINNIKNKSNRRITIEQLPLYPGALVSDGVDDYGICENFPILTKQKGYTVCALRKWVGDSSFLVTNSDGNSNGAFALEGKANSNTFNFGMEKSVTIPDLFTSQTSVKYNGQSINSGELNEGNSSIGMFVDNVSTKGSYAPIAFYALEIYDRDLSDEELSKVKARMIKQYESKTGLKYEEA